MASVKFWLDSANLEDIAWAQTTGWVSGITVNQSLIAKEPAQPLMDMIWDIYKAGEYLTLNFPVVGKDAGELFLNAEALTAKFGMRVINYKVPVSRETLPVIKKLSVAGLRVNATCIFTGLQAAVAAAAGAKILSVFVGRINDEEPGWGWKVLEAARSVCGGAEVLAGSIRDKEMVGAAIEHGAHIITTSRRVLEQIGDDPGTARSMAKFNADLEAWMA